MLAAYPASGSAKLLVCDMVACLGWKFGGYVKIESVGGYTSSRRLEPLLISEYWGSFAKPQTRESSERRIA